MTEKIPPYLPKWATTAEACAYLEEQTGEAWPLVRLLESWLKPSIWLEYSPDAPPELFGDRTGGIFAPLVFANDTGRMAHTRSGLLTMSKLPDGRFFRVSPGIPFDLDELRYSRADLLQLVQGHEPQAASQTGQEAPGADDEDLSKHFDPVGAAQLETMFPAGGNWKKWAERKRSGLGEAAREERGYYNPYRAARWWLDTKRPDGWKWERCLCTLANNLPDRSRHLKGVLTGDFD